MSWLKGWLNYSSLSRRFFSYYNISDSFLFSKFIRGLDIRSEDKLMVSFDIVSLFTNVPLFETIGICADILYRGNLGPASIPEELFLKWMRLATEGVEFSFNETMYVQTDGVVMGSPLGPVLANIFIMNESYLIKSIKPMFI